MQIDADRRQGDVDLGDLLEPDHVGPRPLDLTRHRRGARREVRLLERADGGHERGLIVGGVGRDEGGNHRIHIRADVHVACQHRDVGIGEAVRFGARLGFEIERGSRSGHGIVGAGRHQAQRGDSKDGTGGGDSHRALQGSGW